METWMNKKPDYATFSGLAVALAGIVAGLVLEKGQVQDLTQLSAVLIVICGTIGAVMVSTPVVHLLSALKRSRMVFFEDQTDDYALVDRIVQFALQARRGGIVSIESQAERVPDPFFRKGLLLAVDGTDVAGIRDRLETDLRLEEERVEDDARVFETAGGYAPTIGIIGAVLGLIQVMKHLENIGEVGRGIAVAFVATVYGVASANLLLLPAAMKIRSRAALERRRCELMMEGVIAIAEGMNPHLIRAKLENYRSGKAAAPAPQKAPLVSQTAAAAGRV